MSSVSKIPTSFLVTLLVLLLVAKSIGVVLFWFLPLEGRELQKHYSFTPDFVRVDLSRAFGLQKKASQKSVSKTMSQMPSTSISSLVLKGLYGNDKKGFAMVAKKGNERKVTIVGIGESFEGYTLKSIGLHSVIFTKGGKEFILKLQKNDHIKANVKYEKSPVSSSEEAIHTVQNSDVQYFAKHPNEIWKNISIQERQRGGHIEGFEVRWIRPGSKFAALGLKKGDLIIKANNKRLRSYRDAIDIYRKIDKLDEVSIVVLRNNQEKELVYEINR